MQNIDRLFGISHQDAFRNLQFELLRRESGVCQHSVNPFQQVALCKLAGRKVHRHQLLPQPRPLPGHGLRTGGGQHPFPERHDQTGFFSDGNEFLWRHQTMLRVLPANERLPTNQTPLTDRPLRLVMQHELCICQRPAQVIFQLQTFLHRLIHRRCVECPGITSLRLDLVHRHIGVLHQGFDPGTIGGIDRHAHRGRRVHLRTIDDVGLRQLCLQINDEMGTAILVTDIFQDHQEFVPAQSRHRIGDPHGSPQPACSLDQQLITKLVAEGIIDILEAVEVDEDESQPATVPLRPGNRVLHALFEHQAVGKTGQMIVIGQILDALVGFLAL